MRKVRKCRNEAGNMFRISEPAPVNLENNELVCVRCAVVKCFFKYEMCVCRYDNEYGYSNRVIDLLNYMYQHDH